MKTSTTVITPGLACIMLVRTVPPHLIFLAPTLLLCLCKLFTALLLHMMCFQFVLSEAAEYGTANRA